jgi:hypothetical protein
MELEACTCIGPLLDVEGCMSAIARWTAIVIAIGGFLSAFTELPDKIIEACVMLRLCGAPTHSPTRVVERAPTPPPKSEAPAPRPAEPTPVIPSYTTDWVTGGGGHPYCQPRLAAYQAQYPNFNITVTEPPGEHTSFYNPFKQDRYRYSCIFTAIPKSRS